MNLDKTKQTKLHDSILTNFVFNWTSFQSCESRCKGWLSFYLLKCDS